MPSALERELAEAAVQRDERTLQILRDAEWPAGRVDKIMSAWDSGYNCDTVHFTTVNGKPLTAFLYREGDPERAVVEEVRPGWL